MRIIIMIEPETYIDAENIENMQLRYLSKLISHQEILQKLH